LVYIHSDISRGKKVINELFPNGFPKSILVHDCWSSYFGIETQRHQICIAHLLRELKYLGKLYTDQQWTTNFSDLLHSAIVYEQSKSDAEAGVYFIRSPQTIILTLRHLR